MEKHQTTVVKGKVVSAGLSRSPSHNIPNSLAFIVMEGNKRKSFQIDCPSKDNLTMEFIAPKLVGEQVYYEAGIYDSPSSAKFPRTYAFLRVETGRFAGCQVEKGSNL